MLICRYFVLFFIFSCLGWIWETIYCTLKEHRWANRGFLFGPFCPIYGFGAVSAVALTGYLEYRHFPPMTPWQVYLLGFFGSMVLEYVTSWTLEKLFHAVWWDYSKVPLNIHGRTSVPTSLGFGAAALLVVYGLTPHLQRFTTQMMHPLLTEALALVLTGILSADLTVTVSALTDFQRRILAADDAFQRHMSYMVDHMNEERDRRYALVLKRIHAIRLPGERQERVQQILRRLKESREKGRKV